MSEPKSRPEIENFWSTFASSHKKIRDCSGCFSRKIQKGQVEQMIKAMSLFTVLETLPLVGVVGATLLLVYLYNFFRVYYVIYHRDQLISAKVAENTLSKYAILKNKFVTKVCYST